VGRAYGRYRFSPCKKLAKRGGGPANRSNLKKRIDQGVGYLLGAPVAVDGGWNHGSTRSPGLRFGFPIRRPPAWRSLALHGVDDPKGGPRAWRGANCS